jgi:hypothetical protein
MLHTYGVGAVADLPNLSVVVTGLDDWDLSHSAIVTEGRLTHNLNGSVACLRASLAPLPF